MLGRIGLRIRIVCERQVERRSPRDLPTRGFDYALVPRPAPSLFNSFRQSRRITLWQTAPEQCAENSMHEAPRATIDQGKRCGDQRVVGRAKAYFLGQR